MSAARFWDAYQSELARSVSARPDEYPAGVDAPAYALIVAEKLRAAVEREPLSFGRINYRESRAFRAAAKAVGAPFTRAGLESIYNGAGS